MTDNAAGNESKVPSEPGWEQPPDERRYPPPANEAEAARMYHSIWQGTDGKWYAALEPTPSEGGTGSPSGGASPGTASPVIGTPPPPGYRPMGYGAPGYGPAGYGPMAPYGPYRRTNGLAIAGLVCSFFFFLGLPSLLAIIFGFIAVSHIRSSGGTQKGTGLAISGIVIGFIGLMLVLVAVAIPTFIGVQGNYQRRVAAQATLLNALAAARSYYGLHETWVPPSGPLSQTLQKVEPLISWQAGTGVSTGPGMVVAEQRGLPTPDQNAILLAASSDDGTCWYLLDIEMPPAGGASELGTSGPGTYYGYGPAPSGGACTAGGAPRSARSARDPGGWASNWPPP